MTTYFQQMDAISDLSLLLEELSVIEENLKSGQLSLEQVGIIIAGLRQLYLLKWVKLNDVSYKLGQEIRQENYE